MELLFIILSATFYLFNILYLHIFAALKSVGLLYKFNSANPSNEAEQREIMYMLVYWIGFVCTSFLQHCWGLSALRVVFLVALLSSQINLKKKIFEDLFTGEQLPKFDQYLRMAKEYTVELVNTMKKIDWVSELIEV